ncbi:hypothetical protein, partial [Dysosmobacter welbionis]|uniref:hypothetical protein n=1 Tax=Dysosmobacter welbionis TaxID=2093857 RepID=UPI00300ECD87
SRLQPGRMLLADLTAGRLVDDAEVKERYARQQPYGEWLDAHLVYLPGVFPSPTGVWSGPPRSGGTGCTRPSATPMRR